MTMQNSKLFASHTIQTILLDDDRIEWSRFALENLSRAYGDDEPDYSSDAIQELNPDFDVEKINLRGAT